MHRLFSTQHTMLNALTIDVEDYYHVTGFESIIPRADWDRYESRVERNTHRLLDLLDVYGTKATCFVLGWVAERQPHLVRTIHARGHEVASHGYAHQRVYTQSPAQFRQETQRSLKLLEDLIGVRVHGYRAASYSITSASLWALDILGEAGLTYDSSIFPIHHDRYGIPGYPRFCHVIAGYGGGQLIEFPISTARWAGANVPIAGGGYFRLFPYAMIAWGLRSINQRDRQSALIYLHPWEIDPDQPRIAAGAVARFRQYVNLQKTEAKLSRMLQEFRFGTMLEVLRHQQLVDF
jgi:polysaccharide deacetylase family protein (PEP-CTERM system associated)